MAFATPIYYTKYYEKPTVYSLLLGHRQTDGRTDGRGPPTGLSYFITNFYVWITYR